MNRKLIITKLREKIITAVLENEKIVEFHCSEENETQEIQLGNIYVGRVKNIVANINAAFIEVFLQTESPSPDANELVSLVWPLHNIIF